MYNSPHPNLFPKPYTAREKELSLHMPQLKTYHACAVK